MILEYKYQSIRGPGIYSIKKFYEYSVAGFRGIPPILNKGSNMTESNNNNNNSNEIPENLLRVFAILSLWWQDNELLEVVRSVHKSLRV